MNSRQRQFLLTVFKIIGGTDEAATVDAVAVQNKLTATEAFDLFYQLESTQKLAGNPRAILFMPNGREEARELVAAQFPPSATVAEKVLVIVDDGARAAHTGTNALHYGHEALPSDMNHGLFIETVQELSRNRLVIMTNDAIIMTFTGQMQAAKLRDRFVEELTQKKPSAVADWIKTDVASEGRKKLAALVVSGAGLLALYLTNHFFHWFKAILHLLERFA